MQNKANPYEESPKDPREDLALVASWQKILSDPDGQRVIYDILERTGIYRTTFTGNSHGMFAEGQRSIGLSVIDTLNSFSPDEYFRIMLKQSQRILNDD